MTKAVVIYSGGMDSYTLLHDVNRNRGFDEVVALSLNYGQRHSKELIYAARVCKELEIHHKIADISSINSLIGGSSLTSDIPVPEGHYEEESMKQTVVPNRNMIFLSLAIGYAVSINATAVFYGAHGGDHAIYPDCRIEFVEGMVAVAKLANWEPVQVNAPYLTLDKGDIASLGKAWGLDYGKAWTCYNGREKACGKCGACQERIEAMAKAGIDDPMEYAK